MSFLCLSFVGCSTKEITVDESATIALGDANTIAIDASSTEVKIIPKDIKDIEVHLYGDVTTTNKKLIPKITVNNENNEIDIILKKETEIFVGIVYMNSDLKLEVSIPKSYNNDIHVNNSSGDVNIKDFQLNQLDLKVSSGDIYTADLSFNGATIEASSGNIEMNNTKGKTSVVATSGKVQVNEIYGDLEVETSSGDITIIELEGDIEASASSGDIELINMDGELSAETTSGDINAYIEEVNNNIDLNCTSGRAILSIDEGTNLSVIADTDSGSIECNYELDKIIKEDDTLTGSIGNGEHNINIRTTSGDIEIKQYN